MVALPRLRDLNPLRIIQRNIAYQRIPTWSAGTDSSASSPSAVRAFQWPPLTRMERLRCGARVQMRILGAAIAIFVSLSLLLGGAQHIQLWNSTETSTFYWQEFHKLESYFNGVRTLVPYGRWEAENRYNQSVPPAGLTADEMRRLSPMPPLDPEPYDPYPEYDSEEYREHNREVAKCFLDAEETVLPPDVYAYPGLPQHLANPLYGSYRELGLREGMCFDRFGRLGPYGYGHQAGEGWNGTGRDTEKFGYEEVFYQSGYIDYTGMDWADAQRRCFEKNRHRFGEEHGDGKPRVQRHAYVLRSWTGYNYTEPQIATLRAMISELALKSGGEYDVHLLVQVKNSTFPIWSNQGVYRETLESNVPKEFWGITTLWSEDQMKMYYPGPFSDNFATMLEDNIHGAYRSPHFALQWFSQQHPEYDFYWNWEMDARYTGHYYEFNSRIGEWAKKQPRKGLWERGRRFWFPKFHGDYQTFSDFVERETREKDGHNNDDRRNGPVPIWGPVQNFKNAGMLPPPNDTTPPTIYEADNYSWGVGEDGDLLVFNPLFDPSRTNWVFRQDVTGYDTSLPLPPRRAAIITVARLSKRLLDIMHEETWRMKHTMFPEMWPATVSLHHGLKAVYIPHPVHFNRDWNLEKIDQVLNYPKTTHESPFGWGENNLLGSTFYYNSAFSANLWRRWLGQREREEGGRAVEEVETGRMCLRGMLLHPVKHEASPVE